ncbi:uncharacterized protein LOC114530626 [Dendronephthya gigantea]|uniref:uncharacterized protein LOC114530626 n=1 Tax=Dendronephthya gigantea TaxID=151771 RepID=UPI00106C622F|nr:uncharacterized protein LOC114530626 [Dendronephthya gigantea]
MHEVRFMKINTAENQRKSQKIKWYSIHTWFLRVFLTALALSYVNVANWICWKDHRNKIKCSIFGTCMLVTLVFYVKLNVDTHNTHELDSDQSPHFPCNRTPEQAQELRDLFHDVRDILNEMSIRPFLIYGSVWGAYRAKAPLAWDYDIDLAIIGDETYSQIPKAEFLKPFRERGIEVYDMTWMSSCYYFTRGKFAQVDIDIFYNFHGLMQRSGLITWLLYYNYKKYHSFPEWMVEKPLPKMQFIDVQIEVPRGGMEILKYLYPNDWERPFTPAACKVNNVKEKRVEPQSRIFVNESGKEDRKEKNSIPSK